MADSADNSLSLPAALFSTSLSFGTRMALFRLLILEFWHLNFAQKSECDVLGLAELIGMYIFIADTLCLFVAVFCHCQIIALSLLIDSRVRV